MMTDGAVRYAIVNICGEICERGELPYNGDATDAIIRYLDKNAERRKIRAVGIGVPGIVDGLYFHALGADGQWYDSAIGETVEQRFSIPVMLESDLYAAAFGAGRRYLQQKSLRCENLHLAYIRFDKKCVSAGFLAGGRILRGWKNFAGEIGICPADSAFRYGELMERVDSDEAFIHVAVQLLSAINCFLNPQYIAVGGDAFRPDCVERIAQKLGERLPAHLLAELIVTDTFEGDYEEGMAYLTAEQIFADVQIVKEIR